MVKASGYPACSGLVCDQGVYQKVTQTLPLKVNNIYDKVSPIYLDNAFSETIRTQ